MLSWVTRLIKWGFIVFIILFGMNRAGWIEFDIVDDINNPGQKLHVVAMNEPKPDLLQHEAQALVEGSANENGEFVSNPGGLLLKCPTRYEELDPADHTGPVDIN